MPTKAAAKKTPPTVESLLGALEHPLKEEILALRTLILEADASISEEVKWNAPSFRTTEHFATMHLRARGCVQLILHFGAKKRDASGVIIEDPDRLLEWLGADRATVKFSDRQDLDAKRAAVAAIVRQWIRYV